MGEIAQTVKQMTTVMQYHINGVWVAQQVTSTPYLELKLFFMSDLALIGVKFGLRLNGLNLCQT